MCEQWEFGQVLNGQLGHLYKLGDWKTAEIWPMLKVTHVTIHVKDWIKDTFQCSLLATSTCASFISRLANTDDIDRPIYGLSAQVPSIRVGETFFC